MLLTLSPGHQMHTVCPCIKPCIHHWEGIKTWLGKVAILPLAIDTFHLEGKV